MLPEQVTQKFGADILRIWVASSDVQEDIRVGDEILGSAVDAYRKLRNTMRYLLSALDGYTNENRVEPSEMPDLERYVLHRLWEVNAKVLAEYEAFNFKAAWRALSEFAIQDLSAFYFDIRKDAIYCDAPNSLRRRAARQVMATLLGTMTRLLAPICPFTAEEVYDHFPEGMGERAESVHLLTFADIPESYRDDALGDHWRKLRGIRRVITGAIEEKRNEKAIGGSLEAATGLHIDDPALLDEAKGADWAEISITSQAVLGENPADPSAFRLGEQPGIAVTISRAEGDKCGRCWRVLPEVPEDGGLCGRCKDAVEA
jgi:isoleucyl-tRNA synthetase